MSQRSNFSSKIGFVLAAAGSAVGLGNLWRFPYLAAKYGGGTFLLVYLILAVTFGFSLMIAEIAIGRKTGLSAIGAFKKLDKRFGFLGVLAAIIPIIIFPYYSVIGGWVIKYFVTFVTGNVQAAADDAYFNNFIGTTGEPIGWFCLFIAFTSIIVLLGVEKGIETVSKFMMPVLVVLTVIIAGYGLTVDGAIDGLIYYVKPSMENFSGMTVIAAMGQLFYSMSLAMGIMITYGSYMKKDNNLESSVRQIEVFDTGIAFMAGLFVNISYIVVPIFLMLSSWNKALHVDFFLDNRFILALIYASCNLPFTIYLLSGYFQTLPKGFEEAAYMDGCGYFKTMVKIMIPMAKPSILTVIMFNFLTFWNEYIIAYTLMDENGTLAMGLKNLMAVERTATNYGIMYAGLVIVMIPVLVLYICVQKRLTEGMTLGGLKG